MTTTERIQTQGPADPNAGTRAKIYAAGRLIAPLLGFAATLGLLTQDQVTALNGLIAAATGVLGAFGLFGFNLAAKNTKKQLDNGTFDPAPVVPSLSDAFQAVEDFQQHVATTVADAKAKVAEGVAVIQGAASMIPGGQAVTTAVMSGPVGDLIQAVADHRTT